MDLDEVVFAHAVNDEALLAEALADDAVNFLEADVIDRAGEPVMGHDPGSATEASITLEAWLDRVASAPRLKGVKVDVKEWTVVDRVCALVRAFQQRIAEAHETMSPVAEEFVQARPRDARPMLKLYRRGAYFLRPAIIVNADVLTQEALLPVDAAPGAAEAEPAVGCRFNPQGRVLSHAEQIAVAREFLRIVTEQLPDVVLSLGWVSRPCVCIHTHTHTDDGGVQRAPPFCEFAYEEPDTYPYGPSFRESVLTARDCAHMHACVSDYAEVGVPVSFAIRACTFLSTCVRVRAGEDLYMLLRSCPLSSITLWSHHELSVSGQRLLTRLLRSDPSGLQLAKRVCVDVPPHTHTRALRAATARRRTYFVVAWTFALAAVALPELRRSVDWSLLHTLTHTLTHAEAHNGGGSDGAVGTTLKAHADGLVSWLRGLGR